MGMSSSQVRLGSLTARLHDIEYKAQNIQAQKIALSMDQDAEYQTYCEALDKTKIQVAYTSDTGKFKYLDANFDTVCTFKENRARNYAIQDATTGEIYLNKEQAELYELRNKSNLLEEYMDASEDEQLEIMEEYIAKYDDFPADPQDVIDEYEEKMENWSTEEKEYYTNLFELVDNNRYKILDEEYTSGDTGYNWFNNMLSAGLVLLNEYVDTGSSQGWSDTDVTTSVNSNYLQEVEDETYVKKAEAKYEHALNLINQKDEKFDAELSKLETEEKALTTEIESIEKVRDDNAERTFGIFG